MINKNELTSIHNKIKNHPYRLTFSEDDKNEYKELLYKLSDTWCDIIYRQNTEIKLRQFGEWIHNYRQLLGRTDDLWIKYFDYFEQIVQITHNYIDTDNIDTFYHAIKVGKSEYKINKYIYLTTKELNFTSAYIPGYFNIDTPYITDDETMKNFYNKWYSNSELATTKFEEWQKNEKPMLEYINTNYVKKT